MGRIHFSRFFAPYELYFESDDFEEEFGDDPPRQTILPFDELVNTLEKAWQDLRQPRIWAHFANLANIEFHPVEHLDFGEKAGNGGGVIIAFRGKSQTKARWASKCHLFSDSIYTIQDADGNESAHLVYEDDPDESRQSAIVQFKLDLKMFPTKQDLHQTLRKRLERVWQEITGPCIDQP